MEPALHLFASQLLSDDKLDFNENIENFTRAIYSMGGAVKTDERRQKSLPFQGGSPILLKNTAIMEMIDNHAAPFPSHHTMWSIRPMALLSNII